MVTLEPCEGADTYVNGKKVTEPSVLRSGTVGGVAPLLTPVHPCSQAVGLQAPGQLAGTPAAP